MFSDVWSVTVFKCKLEKVKQILIDFYEFVEGLEDVKDLHFLIRDRVDEVFFSFRVLESQKYKEEINSKIAFKLRSLISEDDFAIDPPSEHPFYKYVAWSDPSDIRGPGKSTIFCSLLSQLSRIVFNMAKKDYFDSKERVEIAHVVSWMLGFTEYGKLTKKEMHVGYYDRIKGEWVPYLVASYR
jgi:hypothetical protein